MTTVQDFPPGVYNSQNDWSASQRYATTVIDGDTVNDGDDSAGQSGSCRTPATR